ncbi:hypothetical protein [Leptolyngbya sp. O-77]|uniref:hypothetical protein n=1 Tax=Leptolyngbya sp. O-77 TaxID=1080068 RepID=UPI00074D30A9|nr:hypothetical protein [Leptolyngbya sp. O-77]BAU41137.1 isopentenyl pyrophosphate isomerase [Leptolyngbya sp. O-77]
MTRPIDSLSPATAQALSAPSEQAIATQARKAEHIRVCLEENVQSHLTTGLERYRFTHCCLPELAPADLNLHTTFLGKALTAPLLISSMTGGTDLARVINLRLAAGGAATRAGDGAWGRSASPSKIQRWCLPLPCAPLRQIFCSLPTWARCS